LLLLLTLCRVGAATEPAEASAVQVMLVGRVAKDPTLGQRISSWFDDAFRVRVLPVARLDTEKVLSPSADGSVQVWVTLATDAEARVYFATVPPGRDAIYSLRVLALENGLDEMGAERLSQVIHLSAVALFQGRGEHQREEVERMLQEEPTPRRKTEPTPAVAASQKLPEQAALAELSEAPTAEASGWRPGARLGVGYGVTYRSVEGYWHGPRARAALLIGWFGFGVSLQGYLPHSEELPDRTPQLRIRFSGIGVDLQPAVHQQLLSWLEIEYLAGLGVDVVRYRPLSALDARVTIGQGDRELRPNLHAGVRAVLGDASVKWALLAQCGLALSRTHYYLGTGLTRREVARPSRVLPLLALEATF
jgi:hypothetical protein